MTFIVKLWLTLFVLAPISAFLCHMDDGDSIITLIAISELLATLALTIGVFLNLIWSL